MTEEKIIETKVCKHCQISFDITDKDLEFYDKISPVFNWVKYSIPSPTLCPDCRQQRRLSFRNERNLYKRKCGLCHKGIVSTYSPNKKYNVYCNECWNSDKWDEFAYWREYNWNKDFFEQFSDLIKLCPLLSIDHKKININCNFSNFIWNCKDCYLSYSIAECENVNYSYALEFSKNSFDCCFVHGWDLCYENLDCESNFNSFWLSWCKICIDARFLFNCENCKDCFLSSNQKNKQFVLKNKQLSKDEYFDEIRKIDFWDSKVIDETKKSFNMLKKKSICKFANIINSINVEWDNILNCKDVINSFSISDSENIKHGFRILKESNWVHDCNGLVKGELIYEWSWGWYNGYKNLFFFTMDSSNNLFYSTLCHNSSNLFGCIWLRNSQYCILNKQYTKQEYETLVPRIIEHMKKTWEWWEFFPSSISPFGYNETVANEYYPLKKEEAMSKWFKWSDYQNPTPQVTKTIPASKLPDNIQDIPDDILNWAILCEVTYKPYRIIKQELDFYRKHSLPIPKRHPDQRHLDRMKLRNPRKLYDRLCDKCNKDIKTTYSPDREEMVYCEECYNKAVY